MDSDKPPQPPWVTRVNQPKRKNSVKCTLKTKVVPKGGPSAAKRLAEQGKIADSSEAQSELQSVFQNRLKKPKSPDAAESVNLATDTSAKSGVSAWKSKFEVKPGPQKPVKPSNVQTGSPSTKPLRKFTELPLKDKNGGQNDNGNGGSAQNKLSVASIASQFNKSAPCTPEQSPNFAAKRKSTSDSNKNADRHSATEEGGFKSVVDRFERQRSDQPISSGKPSVAAMTKVHSSPNMGYICDKLNNNDIKKGSVTEGKIDDADGAPKYVNVEMRKTTNTTNTSVSPGNITPSHTELRSRSPTPGVGNSVPKKPMFPGQNKNPTAPPKPPNKPVSSENKSSSVPTSKRSSSASDKSDDSLNSNEPAFSTLKSRFEAAEPKVNNLPPAKPKPTKPAVRPKLAKTPLQLAAASNQSKPTLPSKSKDTGSPESPKSLLYKKDSPTVPEIPKRTKNGKDKVSALSKALLDSDLKLTSPDDNVSPKKSPLIPKKEWKVSDDLSRPVPPAKPSTLSVISQDSTSSDYYEDVEVIDCIPPGGGPHWSSDLKMHDVDSGRGSTDGNQDKRSSGTGKHNSINT